MDNLYKAGYTFRKIGKRNGYVYKNHDGTCIPDQNLVDLKSYQFSYNLRNCRHKLLIYFLLETCMQEISRELKNDLRNLFCSVLRKPKDIFFFFLNFTACCCLRGVSTGMVIKDSPRNQIQRTLRTTLLKNKVM